MGILISRPVLDKNPLPASVNFKVRSEYANPDSLAMITKELRQNHCGQRCSIQQGAGDQPRRADPRRSASSCWAITVIISVLVIILIDNTIRLAMFSNRFLIKTMQMVGATRWFIAKPMDIRALINGAISGLIAIGRIIGVIFVSEKWLPPMQALRDYTLLAVMFATIFVLGIGISFISTHRSVLKYLKMKLDDLY